MPEAVRESVLSMVREICGVDSIEDKTLIYHDLGIAGDDADELLEKIHAKFGTSFKDLDFHAYFPNDLDAMCYHIGRLFGIRDKRKGVSFGHLVRVVEAGSWFDE